MTLEQIKKMLESAGLPIAYRSFPDAAAPPLPFVCWMADGNDNFAADGGVYYAAKQISVELYTKYKDQATEDKLEKAMADVVWSKTETYIDSERCYQINYEFEV